VLRGATATTPVAPVWWFASNRAAPGVRPYRAIDTVNAVDAVCVIREGSGPEVLLDHGGASPRTTWSGLESLEPRWTLALVHRRGYPPSPSHPGTGHDFDVDASDLASLLDSRPHVVAHSYGVLGTLIAASRAPTRVRSLTLIEPPLFYLSLTTPTWPTSSSWETPCLSTALTRTPRHCASSCVSPGLQMSTRGRFPRRSPTAFIVRTADVYPERHDRLLTSFATPGFRHWWPPAVTRPRWSGFATLWPLSCAPSGSSRPAPDTSSRPRRASQISSRNSSCR